MASVRADSVALRSSVDRDRADVHVPAMFHLQHPSRLPPASDLAMPHEEPHLGHHDHHDHHDFDHGNGEPPSQVNCEPKHDGDGRSASSRTAGQTVAPFLAKHIPLQYAPLGTVLPPAASRRDPNTKYCYRHRPDSKCRRTADEPTMENLQRVCWLPVHQVAR